MERKEIVTAIAAAMGEVKRLGKANENKDQKYSFASIDDFLEMTGPILSKNGLVVVADEESVEDFERQGKYGVTYWLRIRFNIEVMHVSGESLPPKKRTVEVIRTGAQSFGSAQSYVLKQYLRGLLQIPTGEADEADHVNHGDGPPMSAASEGLNNTWRDAVMDRIPANATPRQKAEAFADFICADFADPKHGLRALNNRWERYKETIIQIQSRHPDLGEKIVDAFENRKNEIEDATRSAA